MPYIVIRRCGFWNVNSMDKTERSFLITIDTEGDYIWNRKTWSRNSIKNRITVRNGAYLERFQILCEKYGLKPTYLVNYEMSNSEPFVDMAKDGLRRGTLEIGMHMHGWTAPPYYELERGKLSGGGHPYIGEYPRNIMEGKVQTLTEKLTDTFGVIPRSHRSGRWYLDRRYVEILRKFGYRVDCSVTPGIDWRNNPGLTDGSHGSNYSRYPDHSYEMSTERLSREGNSGIIEVPLTTADRDGHRLQLRPVKHNISDMLWLVEKKKTEEQDYLEFMLHSSEFMRAGSPNFLTERDIEVLYEDIETLFDVVSKDYVGRTLSEYVTYKFGE